MAERLVALIAKPRGVHGWVSAALVLFGLAMLLALSVQSFSSQHLIEHRFWVDMLHATSADHAARVRDGHADTLPHTGIVRSWYVEGDAVPPMSGLPPVLFRLPPGDYSTEDGYGHFTGLDVGKGVDAFHASIVALPQGRLITYLDIEPLESQQNHYARWSTAWAGVLVLFIGGVIAWLHTNLVRPVHDLAERMRAIEPGTVGARLPTTYKREEIQTIALASNAHLQRVDRFIERERSLLDQASHEFRTPIAVIAGAVDVLKQTGLPDASTPALHRIEHAVADLSETMVALLYLAREANPGSTLAEVTVLQDLLPRLMADHEHLLRNTAATLTIGTLEATHLAAPDAMVRIAVSNLVRNAIENTDAGDVELALRDGVISITDTGHGFDPVEAARRYRDSLRQPSPTRGQGLGLFLIGRICDRFGWTLAIEPSPRGGTRATLDVRNSVIAADD